ncbi:hypothetical protein HN51_028857 [Arachis hypogaea]|uniref:RING-type domain-containing protein n=1 Tax=Arachis hypogaea TaxID=3818 RepID=A0A445BGU1_ARAHY|nr:RING-H2 finger protein ATL70-like [Arachis hypogaea]QHO35417.1 Putative RING-H2 finger protein [Arachis hypogaea]RYR37904.1 hypothetical protein Ahy_A09g042822 [Arachis hypogaea]
MSDSTSNSDSDNENFVLTMIINNSNDSAFRFTHAMAFIFGLIFLFKTINFLHSCFFRPPRIPTILHTPVDVPSPYVSVSVAESLEHGHCHGHIDGHIDTGYENSPKMSYSDEVMKKSSVGGGCIICLGDYKEIEMLRVLPGCGHVFHQACVDPWLMLHSTCPICRKSLPHAP